MRQCVHVTDRATALTIGSGADAPPIYSDMSESVPQTTSRPVRTIALMNQKGGVGKTTTTVNLAAGIAQLGRRVLVVDLDPQGHASLHLGVGSEESGEGEGGGGNGGGQPRMSVYDLFLDPGLPGENAMVEVRPNLCLIPAETDLAAVETELANEPDRRTRLGTVLQGVISRAAASGKPFDAVLLDCPPSLGLLTINGLCAAREVFIPMQAHFLALQGVSKLLETVTLIGKSANPRLAVTGVILCMHDANTTHTKEVVADLDEFFEQSRTQPGAWKAARVYRPAVRRNIKLAECPSFGKTIFDYDPACAGAQDYLELAKRIVGEWDKVVERMGGAAVSVVTKAPAPAVA